MRPHLKILLGATMSVLALSSYAEDPHHDEPKELPEPFHSVPDRQGFKALELGPDNTFSVRKTPDDFRLTDFALSPDGKMLALGWKSGRVELFGLQSGEGCRSSIRGSVCRWQCSSTLQETNSSWRG
jgi:hypothetical protein